MANPFNGGRVGLAGPANDMVSITPNDSTDLTDTAVALYVETAGDIKITTEQGTTITVAVTDFAILPVGVTRVFSTGTTATGIFSFLVK